MALSAHDTIAGAVWKSSGLHLVRRDARGRLAVTEDLMRAYYARPELAAGDAACDAERALLAELRRDPFMAVDEARLDALSDPDARDNLRFIIGFRDLLREAGTVEAAYLSLARGERPPVPPMFLDQMVHLIVGNMLTGCPDPIRFRAGEIFFREQTVNTGAEQIMLADREIVDLYAQTAGVHGPGELLGPGGAPREVELDVLGEDNRDLYWDRADAYDTVIDFRFTQPAPDAFARVIETWMAHLMGLRVRVQPRETIKDESWRWHVGLDAEATRILNALFQGDAVGDDDLQAVVALFRMDILDASRVTEGMEGVPVYLGLAMTKDRVVRMKPQNLLVNLPLRAGS